MSHRTWAIFAILYDNKINRYKELLALFACAFTCMLVYHTTPLFIQTTISSCFAQTTGSKIGISEKKNLFALIDKLEKSLPFTGQTVAKLIGRTVTVDPNQSNDYEISSCTSHDSQNFITDISVMEPTKKTTDLIYFRGSVVIKVNQKLDYVNLQDILNHFGKESYIENASLYLDGPKIQSYIYKRSWGRLEFAVELTAPHRLIDIYVGSYRLPYAL